MSKTGDQNDNSADNVLNYIQNPTQSGLCINRRAATEEIEN